MTFFISKVTTRDQKIIVNALKSNSPKGIPLLYRKYTPLLNMIILSIVKDHHDTQDLLQDIFIKIIKNIQSYSEEKGMFSTWVIKIARNHCFDHLRSKNYKNSLNTQPLQFMSENDFEYVNNYISLHSEMIDLKNAMSLLPSELRNLIIESYFNGLTHQQIAEKYNFPLGTVKSRILKTIRLLREILQQNK